MSKRAWVASRKGLFELRLEQGRWRIAAHHFIGDPVSMVLPPPVEGGRLLAALQLGHFGCKLQASDDGGESWQELAAPAYPEQPAAAQGPAWTLGLIWSLERGADGRLWCGTNPGGLFCSEDAGAHWVLQRGLWDRPERLEWAGGGYDAPGIHSICLDPGDASRLLLGISCGGAWRSEDGGRTWGLSAQGMRADFMPPERQAEQNIQDPHRITACAADPRVLWCQHHNGVWRSADGGQRWEELHPPLSSFGFAVAAHPRDPLTAWFVPGVKDERRIPVGAALAVNRTRDGGRSFQTLRAGLPQQHCYDLIYRHGLSGEHLLMGSTTGNLWTSDDGGEHWQVLSQTLPPIYALRFS